MRNLLRAGLACTVILPLGGCGGGSGHPPALRLPSGDSVEMVGSGPVVVANEAPGLMVTFHPFFSLDDTVRVKRVAAELWKSEVAPKLGAPAPSWVVLQATTRRAGPTFGISRMSNYGVVIERRADGRWYYVDTTEPVE